VFTCVNSAAIDAIRAYGGPEGVAKKVFSDISRDSPGVMQQLDGQKPYTARSINDACKGVLKKGKQSVYTKMYRGIPDKSKSNKSKTNKSKSDKSKTDDLKEPGLYSGVTSDLKRDEGHERKFRDLNSTEFHYNYVRGATSRSFRTMATFDSADFRPLFEQSIICLLETQAYYIKQASNTVSFNAIDQEEGDLTNEDLGDLADRKLQGRLFYEVWLTLSITYASLCCFD
jgi:hypothetical protein